MSELKAELLDTGPGPIESSRIRIIVADDDPGIRDIYKLILENAGYDVEIKPDGEDLMTNQFTPPDLFLIDKQLSGFDGLDICKYLKTQRATKNIPLVMISASPDIGPLSKLAGADSYLEKPFDIKVLLDLVKTYTQK